MSLFWKGAQETHEKTHKGGNEKKGKRHHHEKTKKGKETQLPFYRPRHRSILKNVVQARKNAPPGLHRNVVDSIASWEDRKANARLCHNAESSPCFKSAHFSRKPILNEKEGVWKLRFHAFFFFSIQYNAVSIWNSMKCLLHFVTNCCFPHPEFSALQEFRTFECCEPVESCNSSQRRFVRTFSSAHNRKAKPFFVSCHRASGSS